MSNSAIRAGRAFVELFADDSALLRTLRRAEARVIQFGTNIQSIGRKLFTVGAVASLPFGLSAKVFSDFDDQMRAVKAVTGATGKEFEDLTAKAKLLGRTTSFTASQVASAMLELGRAGFAPKEIDEAIPSVLNLARATGTELAMSAEICANTLRAFELPASDMTRVCDVMVAAANNSAQTLLDLGESMTYCAPIASEYGLSLEQTSKALGALANYGIKGSQAGTTLRRILTNLADPQIQKRLQGLGVSVVDGDTGKLRDVTDILRDLGKAAEAMPKDQKLGLFKEIFGLYAIAGGAKLTVAHFDKLIDAVDQAAGTGARTAKEMDAGIGGSMRMLWSAIEGVAIAVGEALAPSLKKMTDYFTNVTSGIADYISNNKELVVSLVKTIAVITGLGTGLFVTGLAFIVLGKTIGAVAATMTTFANIGLAGLALLSGTVTVFSFVLGGLSAAFTAVAGVAGAVFGGIAATIGTALSAVVTVGTVLFSVLAGAVAAVLSPIGLIVLALAALGGAVYLISRNFSAIGNTVSSVFGGIGSAIRDTLRSVYAFLNRFVEFKIIFSAVQIVTNVLRTLGQTFLWLGQRIILPVIRSILDLFIGVGRQVFAIGTGIVSTVLSLFSRIAGFIGTVFSGLVGIVRTIFTGMIAVIGNVFSGIGRIFVPVLTVVSTVFGEAVRFIGGFVNALRGIAGWILSVGRNFFVMEAGVQIFSLLGRAASGFAGLLGTAAHGILSVFVTAIQNIPAVIAGIIPFFTAVPGMILSVFRSIPQRIGGVFSTAVGIVHNVVNGIGTTLRGLVSLLSGMWNGLIGVFSTVFATLGSIVSGFGNFFLGAFTNVGIAVDWLKEMFGSLCTFASETVGAVSAAIGRGDIEAAIQVIWATIKLIWVQGSTALISTWYWVTETLQTAWAACVFKISELLTTAWFGVQEFWTETVYTMSALWVEFSNGVVSAWKTAEQAIAQGIGYIIAKMQGLDPNEMANIISEDYDRQNQQRENEKVQRLNAIQSQRDTKMSSLKSEKEGTLNALNEDFSRGAASRQTDYNSRLAAREAELQAAKQEYNDAVNKARNPAAAPQDPAKPESLQDRLKTKAEELIKGFKPSTDLASKVSVSGSFSAAAIQNMGFGSSMDRVAKATERSEKHLAKLADKKEKPEKPVTKNQPAQEKSKDKDPVVNELTKQTGYLRDI